jgi:hypothetical protein
MSVNNLVTRLKKPKGMPPG